MGRQRSQDIAASAKPTGPGERQAVFPAGAVGLYLAVLAITLFYMTVPALLRDTRLGAWTGTTYHGRCLVYAWLGHPDGPAQGLRAEGLKPGMVSLFLRFDNTRGIRPVVVDLTRARLYDHTGRSIPSLPASEALAVMGDRADLRPFRVPAGRQVDGHLFFPSEPVTGRMESLYALQIVLDGETMNVPGLFRADPAGSPPVEEGPPPPGEDPPA